MNKLKIADLETVKNELKKLWANDKGMIDYCIKKYDYYMFEDKIIEFENFKNWGIDKTIYYDDETEAPKVTLDYFKHYNKTNIKQKYDFSYWYLVKHNDKANIYSICNSRIIDKFYDNFIMLNVKDIEFDSYNRVSTYKMSEENNDIIEDFKELIKNNIENYNIRLEKYFKRYNKNIYTRGYWVNR